MEVYVDDIIFGSDDEKMSKDFSIKMQQEFEISLLGELNFFLGFQIVQSNKGNLYSSVQVCERYG